MTTSALVASPWGTSYQVATHFQGALRVLRLVDADGQHPKRSSREDLGWTVGQWYFSMIAPLAMIAVYTAIPRPIRGGVCRVIRFGKTGFWGRTVSTSGLARDLVGIGLGWHASIQEPVGEWVVPGTLQSIRIAGKRKPTTLP